MTREKMTLADARKLVGGQPYTCLVNMTHALCIHSLLNTAEDWLHLEAAVTILGRKAPRRAREALAALHERGTRFSVEHGA